MGNIKNIRLLVIFVVLSIAGALWYGPYAWRNYQSDQKNQISYTSFMDKVNAGSILKVRIAGDQITADGKAGEKFLLFLPAGAELSNLLLAKRIDFTSG